MNPYDGPDGEGSRPDEDFDADMIMMSPPRWQRRRYGRPVTVAGVAVVALAGGAGVGYAATHSIASPAAPTAAVAAAASPSPSARPAAPQPGPMHRWRMYGGGGFPAGIPGGPVRFARGPIGGGLVHGAFTVPKAGGGYQTLDVQRGTVTAVSATSVTVKSADGYTATYNVTSKTVVDAEAAGIGSVKKGDTIVLFATVSGGTATASNIMDTTAIKSGHASFGYPGPANPPKAPAQPPTA